MTPRYLLGQVVKGKIGGGHFVVGRVSHIRFDALNQVFFYGVDTPYGSGYDFEERDVEWVDEYGWVK